MHKNAGAATVAALVFCVMLSAQPAAAQKFEPNWASLDKRPSPEWYRDAKFGIFIHWGVYSVPSWRPKGSYAEWYWRALVDKHDSTWVHHNRVYGKNFRYQDFAPLFKAELFEPEKWAGLFKRAGARYVVLTSKHHDGFALWPSKHSWNWNSVDIGPHRDLLGDLTTAVRSAGLKMGFYYSLYEWFNPLYRENVDRYVAEHALPQFKDAVTRYKPSIIFADGEWDHPSKVWRSEEFLAWLFNESPAPKDIVINDRWGSDTRARHGGYYSTEYENVQGEISGKLITRGWEECRGIGASFGYNRNEDVSDYQTGTALVHMLIEIASKGGNLLLNIGPAADGRIPVIMQERLLQIGDWLRANGEAIYGTRASYVFSEGKDVRFTRSKDGKYIYAILLRRPGQQITLSTVQPVAGSEVTLLHPAARLPWRLSGDKVVVDFPDSLRRALPSSPAYCLRITARPHVEKPRLESSGFISMDRPLRVALATSTAGAEIYYTLDGREPDEAGIKYTKPFVLKSSARLRARAFHAGMTPSVPVDQLLSVLDSKKHGMPYRTYVGAWDRLPDFARLKPAHEGITYELSLDHVPRPADHFAIVFRGKIDIPAGGTYTFYLLSDDGSKLFLDGKLLIDNDGLHGKRELTGQVRLQAGPHAFALHYFDKAGNEALALRIAGPGLPNQPLPPYMLLKK